MRNGSRQRAARARNVTKRVIMWEHMVTPVATHKREDGIEVVEVATKAMHRVLVGGGQPKRVLRTRAR